VLARLGGDYDMALDRGRQSLAVFEQLGDRAGLSASCFELGVVSYLRGDYDAALDWYRKSLTICEQLGQRRSIAGCYHELGRGVARPRRL
jgi:tetratricopeptide (TPR) repeat protein